MGKLIVLLLLAPWLTITAGIETTNGTDLLTNSTDPNKDMYVIHAMVYQVGILTNKTDNETANFNTTGNQEAVTFYHTNGSHVDLSNIGNPLLTNVTAQSMVGVAPIPAAENATNHLPWSTLNLANMAPSSVSTVSSQLKQLKRSIRSVDIMDSEMAINFDKNVFKRAVPVVQSGAAVILRAAGVQSIALPPLLTLNMSQIPVPIPNTSVVHYAKINTLVSKT